MKKHISIILTLSFIGFSFQAYSQNQITMFSLTKKYDAKTAAKMPAAAKKMRLKGYYSSSSDVRFALEGKRYHLVQMTDGVVLNGHKFTLEDMEDKDKTLQRLAFIMFPEKFKKSKRKKVSLLNLLIPQAHAQGMLFDHNGNPVGVRQNNQFQNNNNPMQRGFNPLAALGLIQNGTISNLLNAMFSLMSAMMPTVSQYFPTQGPVKDLPGKIIYKKRLSHQ